MRGQNEIFGVPEAAFGGQRLGVGHVERGAPELPCVKRVAEGFGVERGSPSHIDEDRTLLHFGNPPAVHDVAGAGGSGQTEGHHVGPRNQLVELFGQAQFIDIAGLFGTLAADSDDKGAHRLDPPGEFPADVAEADDQHCHAGDGPHLSERLPEGAVLLVAVAVQLFAERKQHPEHVFGDSGTVAAGCVGEQDPIGQRSGRGVAVGSRRVEL